MNMDWLIQLPVLLFSIIVHEVAHGYVAYKRGDDTAYLMGRLTFNPLPHIDLFGTIIFPFLAYMSHMPMFGWAKPVPVNPYRLSNSRKDLVMVSLSGPMSNILLSFLSAVMCKVIVILSGFIGQPLATTLFKVMIFSVKINLILAFFNLIPVHPLDGSKILAGLLPDDLSEKYKKHVPYGMFILFGLFITGLFKFFILPPMIFMVNLFVKIGLLPF
jgi:Zn-dependent protease